MKFVFPILLYKEKAVQFINEFYEYNSKINGSGALDGYLQNSTYEEWIKKVYADIDIANVPQPRVPALTYFYVREEDDKIIGMINIRLALNDFLKKEGGHIYSDTFKEDMQNCGECGEVPCKIWFDTRDPKFSDEEFNENVATRVRVLRKE